MALKCGIEMGRRGKIKDLPPLEAESGPDELDPKPPPPNPVLLTGPGRSPNPLLMEIGPDEREEKEDIPPLSTFDLSA